jgi:hypothetical protein
MKNYTFFLVTLLLFCCCNNNDDDGSTDPIDQLPPATQIGANTFGCLLDGEPFIPGGGTNPLDCVYQLVDGEYFFALQGNKRDGDFNLIAITLSTNAMEIEEGSTYILMDNIPNSAFGGYFFNTDFIYTDNNHIGEMTITKLDVINQIVSGTFFFDIIDQNGELRQIREGRFDMQFTQ